MTLEFSESREARPVVLVVDDEAFIRMLVVDVLDEMGFEAVEAEDGASALDILRSERPLAFLVTDVTLGDMKGGELLAAAREARPGLKALFVTGYPDMKLLPGGRPDRDTRLLGKPFLVETLIEEIEMLLERSVKPAAAAG